MNISLYSKQLARATHSSPDGSSAAQYKGNWCGGFGLSLASSYNSDINCVSENKQTEKRETQTSPITEQKSCYRLLKEHQD
jgi:hypothetical protein